MPLIHIFIVIVIGAVAGWLATRIVRGYGLGLPANIILGVCGAFVAGWLLPRLGVRIGGGILAALIGATLGAIVILLVVVGLQRLKILPRRIGR